LPRSPLSFFFAGLHPIPHAYCPVWPSASTIDGPCSGAAV
jgi:hypothetical protein